GKPSDQRTLNLLDTISGNNLQPKSIVYSGSGLFFAQNMMYRHNVSVFDPDGNEVAVISDRINLADFGIEGGVVRGSPVEAAFSSNGAYAYVSNYKMYGDGWNPIASDDCQGRNWDPSFVYRIDTATFSIDQVILVGAVPKFLAVTPDDKTLLVSNFCSQDVSIVDLATGAEVQRIEVGLHPRGIAITKDSTRAYISVMGASRVVVLDLKTMTTTEIDSAGPTPRHLVLSPDDTILYVSNNHAGTVRAISTLTGKVIAQVHTGEQPRSMALSEDGASLYVVNYIDNTLSKIRTSDFTIIQTMSTGVRPVGVTYDPVERRIWVANYSGTLSIYQDE
ncbi:MAG: beta-propeller fold lactonase family protein, partial [Ilumatobacteraceae bacterium]